MLPTKKRHHLISCGHQRGLLYVSTAANVTPFTYCRHSYDEYRAGDCGAKVEWGMELTTVSERLEILRLKHEQALLASLDFLKDVVEVENELSEEERYDEAKAALTELFETVLDAGTVVIVERVVSNIDEIVRQVRFPGWQQMAAGEREVAKALRKSLYRYQLKNQDLLDRAYAYIVKYY